MRECIIDLPPVFAETSMNINPFSSAYACASSSGIALPNTQLKMKVRKRGGVE